MLIDELRHINPLKIAIINNTGSFSYGEIISSAYIIQQKIKAQEGTVVEEPKNLFELLNNNYRYWKRNI